MGNVILGILIMAGPLAGPQTIYSLRKQFEKGLALFYQGGFGSLRAALTGLLERGEIEFEEGIERGRHKKLYRPTARGIAAFYTWMTTPIVGSDVETQALARCYFLGLVDNPATRREILAGIVTRIEAETDGLEAIDEQLNSLDYPAALQSCLTYQRATLAYGIGAHRYAVDFFTTMRDAETLSETKLESQQPARPAS